MKTKKMKLYWGLAILCLFGFFVSSSLSPLVGLGPSQAMCWVFVFLGAWCIYLYDVEDENRKE